MSPFIDGVLFVGLAIVTLLYLVVLWACATAPHPIPHTIGSVLLYIPVGIIIFTNESVMVYEVKFGLGVLSAGLFILTIVDWTAYSSGWWRYAQET